MKKFQDPTAALAHLAEGLNDAESLLSGASAVDPSAIPEPCRGLLVHQEHMTTRLQSHYGRPVSLRVLQEEATEDRYRRMILLVPADSEEVVEFGIVRIDLRRMISDVRTAILQRSLPLGEVLARHGVSCRVEPRGYLYFPQSAGLVSYFTGGLSGPGLSRTNHDLNAWRGDRVPAKLQRSPCPVEAYGRIALMHCDGRPALELLEVVPTRDSQ